MAEVAARSRADARCRTRARRSPARSTSTTLLAEPYVADPLRAHDCAPITDGAAVVVLAAGDRARELCERPAWITGIEHRVDSPIVRRARPDDVAVRGGGRQGRGGSTASRSPSCTRRSRTRRSCCARHSGSATTSRINPSGGVLTRQPDVRRRAGRGSARRRAACTAGDGRPRARARHQRPAAATEPRLRDGRAGLMRPAAVVGTGQTHHAAKRLDVSMAGLCREAIDRAMADAGVDWPDIDAVVLGKAPDLFEGVMMPELFLADALGAVGKPLLRVHTAGSVGGSTANVAAIARAVRCAPPGAGRGVREAVRVQRDVGAVRSRPPFTMPVHAGAGGYFAPHVRSYIRRSGAPEHIGAIVAVKDRRNGALQPVRAPAAARHHGRVGARVHHAVGPDPLRRDLPVLGRRVRRDHLGDEPTSPVVGGVDPRDRDAHRADDVRRTRPGQPAGRPRRGARRCGSRRASPTRCPKWTPPRSTCRSRGSSRCGWRTSASPRSARAGSSPRPARPRSAAACRSTRAAACCRRTRSARPACSASPRRPCRSWARAGDHQVDGARIALGHAYGGGSQFFAMWVVGSEKP